MFVKQFENNSRFVNPNSGLKHPLFEDAHVLTVSEMMSKVMRGEPLSVFQPKQEIKLNSNFFNDRFDIIDHCIRHNSKLKEEQKAKALEQQAKLRDELSKFQEWKKQQEVEFRKGGTIDSLSSIVPTDTKVENVE